MNAVAKRAETRRKRREKWLRTDGEMNKIGTQQTETTQKPTGNVWKISWNLKVKSTNILQQSLKKPHALGQKKSVEKFGTTTKIMRSNNRDII